jgi:hypothetical protein
MRILLASSTLVFELAADLHCLSLVTVHMAKFLYSNVSMRSAMHISGDKRLPSRQAIVMNFDGIVSYPRIDSTTYAYHSCMAFMHLILPNAYIRKKYLLTS